VLEKLLKKYFANLNPLSREVGEVRVVIAPHAGIRYSGHCASQAYGLVDVRTISRVIILGPSHRANFTGACVSTFQYNETPLGKIKVDTKITKNLSLEKDFFVNNSYMQNEHSIENQLPFIQHIFKDRDYSIVPIMIGTVDKQKILELAATIDKYRDKNTLIVVSSDFTHYGKSFNYTPFKDNIREKIQEMDFKLISFLANKDLLGFLNFVSDTGITVCGNKPIAMLIPIFSDNQYSCQWINYYNSGDLSGSYSHCVSYVSILGIQKRKLQILLDQDEQNKVMALSRYVLENYLDTPLNIAEIQSRFPLTENLKKKRGLFVTLRNRDKLRGCVGSLVTDKTLFVSIIEKTLDAALRDPRFPLVKKLEAPGLSIEISIMTPLKKIQDYREIRLGTDGVYLILGTKNSVFLPQVATETGWGLDRFLSELCRKGGMPDAAYKQEDIELYIFQVQKIE
jgi:AmmeMemoRadiSam system protein B/AmmeMemoRadiSam system protein A